MAQKPIMLRAEVGMRVRCANNASAECDSGGRGALAKFLGKFSKSEVFVCRGQEAQYFHPPLKWKLFMK
jgi:hypothetical protein